MKLSEAILLGSVGSKQGFGMLSIYADYPDGKCALGAAFFAIGKQHPSPHGWAPYQEAREEWPQLTIVKTGCPVKSCFLHTKEYSVLDFVPHLNDAHEWTRPRIAAWVATFEPQEDGPQKGIDSMVEITTDALPVVPVREDAPAAHEVIHGL